MTAPLAEFNSGWTGFQWGTGNDTAPSTATPDLTEILGAADLPILVARRDFTLACFNRAAGDALGLSSSDIGRRFRDISVLAAVSRLEQQCSGAMAAGVESQADFREGDRWFVVRISPYPVGGLEAAGAVLTFNNVTAFRTSIDQAIYERECTKAILNAGADPIAVLSADHGIQSGNRAFYRMFGVAREEAQGVPLYDLGNGTLDRPALHQHLSGLLASGHGSQRVELDHVETESGPRTLILDAHPLSFPGHSERRVLVTFQDITARKLAEAAKDLRSEEELRRSEASLAEGQRLSVTGSFSWKVPTDELKWSEELYRIFAFEPGSRVTIERIMSRVHPEDVSMMEKVVEQARSDGANFEYSLRLLMQDGSVKYVTAIAHGTFDAEQRLEYIGAVQDVTQRRTSEEALAKASSELAKVSRITSLGVLTASIAHEVNQPLSGIITNAGTCLRMLDADHPNLDGARETVRRIIRDGNRAAEVIVRLRALFSNEDFTLEPLDLNETTREVLALSLSDLRRNGVALRSEFDHDLPTITADRIQLQQVILNLVRNASDAMVDVHDRKRHLLIRTQREPGDRVRLIVRDAGTGIDPESMNKLLDAFYTTKSDGMGIGLSVSRSIIERHQGHLWAEPNVGPGATFAFSIPIDPANAADAVGDATGHS